MNDERQSITDVMRSRILRGLHAGAINGGDRLPSARDLETEFGVDHRAMLSMYRDLAGEGLVEVRPRSGIYVANLPAGTDGVPPLPMEWIVDLFVSGIARELPVPDLHEWLRRSVETLRLRAIAIAATPDQTYGLCRELRDDYGLEMGSIELSAVQGSDVVPVELRSADLVVTTEGCVPAVQPLTRRLGKPCIVVTVREDVIGNEWQLLLRQPVYVVAESAVFVDAMLKFFASSPNVHNIRPVVIGRDDIGAIPAGAPTYVTQRARELLRGVEIPGTILPAARLLSTQSAREIVAFIVRANLQALSVRSQRGDRKG